MTRQVILSKKMTCFLHEAATSMLGVRAALGVVCKKKAEMERKTLSF